MVQGKGFGIQMIYFEKKNFFLYIGDRFYIIKCTEIRRIVQTNYATSVKQYLCRNRIGLP